MIELCGDRAERELCVASAERELCVASERGARAVCARGSEVDNGSECASLIMSCVSCVNGSAGPLGPRPGREALGGAARSEPLERCASCVCARASSVCTWL